jgi:hypothetical protein
VLRYRNGPAWTAFQCAVIGEVVRTIAWAWRVAKHPGGYLEPELNMFVILFGQMVATVATWFLAVQMRRAQRAQTKEGSP